MPKHGARLTRDAEKARRQNDALDNLKQALESCALAGIVFIRTGNQVFAFDEDTLFASGWTHESDLHKILSMVSHVEVDMLDTVLLALSRMT